MIIKDELRKLFANINEKRLKNILKSSERDSHGMVESNEKQCINYKKLFVNKYNIENGKLFIEQNYKDLKAFDIFMFQKKS